MRKSNLARLAKNCIMPLIIIIFLKVCFDILNITAENIKKEYVYHLGVLIIIIINCLLLCLSWLYEYKRNSNTEDLEEHHYNLSISILLFIILAFILRWLLCA